MGSISTRQKPARLAYAVRVSGRMSVPVEAEGLSAMPTGKQPRMLNPYSSCSRDMIGQKSRTDVGENR
jgi:hypothetical protein